jgi:YD repeat-containing protein
MAHQGLASDENMNGLCILHAEEANVGEKLDKRWEKSGDRLCHHGLCRCFIHRRDAEGRLLGKTSEQFNSTRDAQGRLISVNTADGGLLFGNDDE